MGKLFPVLIAVFVVVIVVVFSAQVQAGGWHHGGRGHGWHRAWSGGHGWSGAHRWYQGVGRWHSGWRGWYPTAIPGPVIVDDWADCQLVRRCFIDRYGCRRCRWVKVCPW